MLYQIEFHSFWHMGTGMVTSARLDNIVKKDQQGLPIIPGKTIKGLLRDAAQQLHELDASMVTKDFIKHVFGAKKEDTAKQKTIAKCHFPSARLAPELAEEILANKQVHHLYDQFASTKIDENGLADDQSLRVIEVTIPLVLFGEIVDFPEEQNKVEQLQKVLQFVKRMGAHRHRGLGRCTWTLPHHPPKPA